MPPGGLPPDPGTVAPPLITSAVTDLGSATSFLYTAPNPIQTGVANGTIEFRRAAVLRGKVKQRNDAALSGVRISILNHPEFGQTLSRADGMFDMAVNGGGLLTLHYEKAGYCTVQRQVNAPWQDYVSPPDIVMIQMDPAVTTVAGTGGNGISDNGGPAAQAALSGVVKTAMGPDGSLYVLERGAGRVRRIVPLLPGLANLVSGADTVSTPLTWDRDGILTGFGPFTFAAAGPGGALSRITDGTANTLTTYTYDRLARISGWNHQVSGQATYSMQLSYDNTGHMTGKIETVNGTTHTYAYIYDVDGQLTEVQRDGAAGERYTYDVNGNRISRQQGNGAVETASYDTQDRLTLRGAVAYQFDADGFLAQRGSDTFLYSARGQLLRATTSGQTVTYGYDGLGRRVTRTDAGDTTQYLYGDPASHMVTAVRNSGGTLTMLYYDTWGLLIALELGGALFHVATDQVGTPCVVSNSAGSVVKTLDHDSFGILISDSNPAFDLPVDYAGGLADTATGLVHFAFRDYDPASGRWTARDPVFFEGGQGNLFVYVGSNPVNNRDPLGLWCVSASLYKGIGGGSQLCFTKEGTSLCLEVGIGVGGGIGVDTGGLEKNGKKITAELTLKCGPLGLGGEASLDDTGCLKAGPVGQAGKFKAKRGKLEAKFTDNPKLKFNGTKCSATGKLAGKVCRMHKY